MGQLSLFGKPRLLLVSGEDNGPLIDLMKLCGAEMICAPTAKEGLSRLRSEEFDAVLIYVYLGTGASRDDEEFQEMPFERYFAGLRLLELVKNIGFKRKNSEKSIPVVVMNTVPKRDINHFVNNRLGEKDLHFFPPDDSMKIVSHLRNLAS